MLGLGLGLWPGLGSGLGLGAGSGVELGAEPESVSGDQGQMVNLKVGVETRVLANYAWHPPDCNHLHGLYSLFFLAEAVEQ